MSLCELFFCYCSSWHFSIFIQSFVFLFLTKRSMLCTELKSIIHWFSLLFIDNSIVTIKVHDTLNLYWSISLMNFWLCSTIQSCSYSYFTMIDCHRSHFLNLSFPIETYCLYECRPLSSVTKSKLLVVAIWPNWNVNQTKLVVGPERAPGRALGSHLTGSIPVTIYLCHTGRGSKFIWPETK